jgi:hypothetical protein
MFMTPQTLSLSLSLSLSRTHTHRSGGRSGGEEGDGVVEGSPKQGALLA